MSSSQRVRRATYREAPSLDWWNRVVVVWEEDDALVPDREKVHQAFARICGSAWSRDTALARHDGGDTISVLHPGGWVTGACCGLGFVGVVAVVLEPGL